MSFLLLNELSDGWVENVKWQMENLFVC